MKTNIEKKIKQAQKDGVLIDSKDLFEEDIVSPSQRKYYEKIAKGVREENSRLIRERLAKKIKKARELSGKTQEELAKLMKTKKSYISKIESGKQNISVEYVVRVATALGRQVNVEIY